MVAIANRRLQIADCKESGCFDSAEGEKRFGEKLNTEGQKSVFKIMKQIAKERQDACGRSELLEGLE